MSLFDVFAISGSSLSAQTIRLNVTASNLANADAISSSIDTTYRARQPVFATLYHGFEAEGGQSAGVYVRGIIEKQTPLQANYQPDHPMANEEGYVFKPNVNPVEEMANMISASRSYQNSVEVMNTSKQLLSATLKLGQS